MNSWTIDMRLFKCLIFCGQSTLVQITCEGVSIRLKSEWSRYPSNDDCKNIFFSLPEVDEWLESEAGKKVLLWS